MRSTTTTLLLLLMIGSGCGGGAPAGPERATVKGKVLLDDQPVNGGTITFQGGKTATGGGVQNGEFKLTGENGVPLGEYTVRFNWMKPTGKKILEPDSGQQTDETAEAIPAKYNLQSTEKVTIKAGENALNFDLKSK